MRRLGGLSHIWRFIAGTTTSGQVRALAMVEIRSLAAPCASLNRQSAVAGTITNTSARRDISMCAIALSGRLSHTSLYTALPDSAWKVSGVTKRVAASLITTST
ncbi:hypothetical protein D3C72_1565170 [compost metagenome]